MMHHVVADLHRKGCIDNYSTRPGEGFQQEVKQAYRQTSRRNVESQVITFHLHHQRLTKQSGQLDDNN